MPYQTQFPIVVYDESDYPLLLETLLDKLDYEGELALVIGKGGRTANALRTVVKAAAVREDCRVLVDIVD